MPAEHGLPQYVSKHPDTGIYRYFRRPPKGVAGATFVRSFGTKDKKAVGLKYGPIHAEAEAYFACLISGLSLSDPDLTRLAGLMWFRCIAHKEVAPTGIGWSERDFLAAYDFMTTEEPEHFPRDLAPRDRAALHERLNALFRAAEEGLLREKQDQLHRHYDALRKASPQPIAAPAPADAFTLKDAFDQAWVPAKNRGRNTVVEIGRYVDEFMTLNGALDLREYTREHWAAWRKDCLDRHGPGPTAFKRFSMMKTVVNEAIRAGLFERKNFTGMDVSMRKTKPRKLRNEGWLGEELETWFGSDYFRHPSSDADYWIAVIIALTGARLSEVTGMQVPDVALRHDMWTFYLAKEHGKTEESRRIIPIPKKIIELGFMAYLKIRPKKGPLFEGMSAKKSSQTYSRWRADLGLTRKGCDIHAFRHHMKTLLTDLHAPDRVNDYITGHAQPGVAARYGKVLYQTCLEFLDKVDLGITIPNWKG